MVGIRSFLLGGVFGLMLAWGATGAAAAAETEAKAPFAARIFIGLWEGIDDSDGSLTQRSIVCEGPTSCRVIGADSFLTLCKGGRGVLHGTGTITRGVLKVPGFTLTCFDGLSVSVDTTFTPDFRNGTLVEQTANPQIKPITFHRISHPEHGGAR
jgi:hypothetical protein